MPNTKIIIEYDNEKLSAIRQFAANDAQKIENVLQEQIEKIYVKTVPAPVRKYIEGKVKSAAVQKTKSNTTPQTNL